MELHLTRVEYMYTVAGITNKNCLTLLPGMLPNEPQKIAIADSEGILQVVSVKKDDVQIHFKTLPGPAIGALKVSGATGTIPDKVFIAAGTEVKGFTKKGKLFLVFDSGITEPITSMFVLGNELFLCGKHAYNHFRDCREVGSYLCGDVILDVIAFYMTRNRRLTSLIACEGRMIRVLEHARVTSSMEVESTPTVLHIYDDEDAKLVLFGTTDGRIGILDLENLQGFQTWLIQNDQNSSAITCIDSYHMNESGQKNIILGRQDGNIEIYHLNMAEDVYSPMLIFIENCNESITALQCGIVGSLNHKEVVVATYSGRIFGLTTQLPDTSVDGGSGNIVLTGDATTKISKLRSEIEDLQIKIAKERDRYQLNASMMIDEVSAIIPLPVNFSFALDKISSTYFLILECPTSIENVLLQCNANIELQNVEKTTAILSKIEPAEYEIRYNKLLVTCRCQMNTNRIELKFKTKEGERGFLQTYITTILQPKCSRLLQFDIKPLSLHYRIYKFDNSERPYNKLTVKGMFSLAEFHTWMMQCIPEVPEKSFLTGNTLLYFQSSLVNTVLSCTYQKGEAEFWSDSVTTLAIIKGFLSEKSTEKKANIDFGVDIKDNSIDHVIKLIEPKLIQYQTMAKDVRILNALEELEIIDEENLNYLTQRYRGLLENKKNIFDTYKNSSNFLEKLYDTISDLYINYKKFKGQSAAPQITKIFEALEPYNFENLIEIFKPNTSGEEKL